MVHWEYPDDLRVILPQPREFFDRIVANGLSAAVGLDPDNSKWTISFTVLANDRDEAWENAIVTWRLMLIAGDMLDGSITRMEVSPKAAKRS